MIPVARGGDGMSKRGKRQGAEQESGASSFQIDNQIGAGEPAGGEVRFSTICPELPFFHPRALNSHALRASCVPIATIRLLLLLAKRWTELRGCACRAFSGTSPAEARKFFVGGNWKCNGSVSQVNVLISMLNQSTLSTDAEVVVCPSQVYVQGVQDKLRPDVAVDVWTGGNGAFTGETSADMLKDTGVQCAVVGHSERHGKGESDAEVAAKAKYALSKGLKVIACCGEPLENWEAVTTNDFVFPQIKAYSDVFSKDDWDDVVVAIWARSPGPTSQRRPASILYGGSASTKTAPGLSSKPDINGFLVGGASLKPEFADIVNCNGTTKSLKPVTIGINGFGRIGRLVMRDAHGNPMVNIVAANDPFVPLNYMEYMLQHDTAHGHFPGKVAVSGEGKISVSNKPVRVFG
ncbi:LOW QUALITY PROTEIN: hypothetical protein ACHAWF_017426 [Thalassiosira exigua]